MLKQCKSAVGSPTGVNICATNSCSLGFRIQSGRSVYWIQKTVFLNVNVNWAKTIEYDPVWDEFMDVHSVIFFIHCESDKVGLNYGRRVFKVYNPIYKHVSLIVYIFLAARVNLNIASDFI